MSTQDTSGPQTLEQKIDLAAAQAAQIADIFSPAIGTAINMGVAAEPVIAGMIHLFASLFKHHASQATPAAPAPVAAPAKS